MTKLSDESQLFKLKARREQLLDDQVLHLSVPRWESPTIRVSYKPLDVKFLRARIRQTEKAKSADRDDAELRATMDLLIKSCVGVTATNPDQTWSAFDDELAEALDIENPTAQKVVRSLFLTDGDIYSHAQQLIEWSGFKNESTEDEFAGE